MQRAIEVKYTYACLYINLHKDPQLEHSYALCHYLSQLGLQIVLDAADNATILSIKERLQQKFVKTPPHFYIYSKERPKEFSDQGFFIAIGGDGTFLEAVHHALRWNIPLVGFKLGRLGFLAAITEQDYEQKLKDILAGKSKISHRLLLHCQINNIDGSQRQYLVFNDLVLSRQNVSRIAQFNLQIDGTLADVVPADGIIVATPSGSTAYALAAGGAIIDPACDVLEVSPICPHSLHNRSYVVRSTSEISITFPKEQIEDVCVFIDGKAVSNLAATANLLVTKADIYSRILTFDNDSFVADLEQKLKSH